MSLRIRDTARFWSQVGIANGIRRQLVTAGSHIWMVVGGHQKFSYQRVSVQHFKSIQHLALAKVMQRNRGCKVISQYERSARD